jgi:hypothetical protein
MGGMGGGENFSVETASKAAGIAIGYRLDDRGVGVRVPVEARIFTTTYRSDRL